MACLVRLVENVFSWLNARFQDAIQSQAVEVLQDIAVCAKSAVAFTLVYIFLEASLPTQMCDNTSFYYCEGTEDSAKVRRGIVPSNALCKPKNDAKEGRTLFLCLAVANMLVFLFAIFLKHTVLRMRYPSFKAFVLCAFSFVLTCLKLGVVVYIGEIMQNYFSCSKESPQDCRYFNDMMVFYIVDNLIPSRYNCIDPQGSYCPGSRQKAPGKLQECRVNQALDCMPGPNYMPGPCKGNLTSETYVLSISFVLSFLYITYLLHEYQEHHINKYSKHDGTSLENDTAVLSENASGDNSSVDSSKGLTETTEENRHLLAVSSCLVKGPQNGRKQGKSQKIAFRMLRDLSTFTKYIIVISTLLISLSSGELAYCSEINKTTWPFLEDESISADMVTSKCQPRVLNEGNIFSFIISISLFIITFVPAVILEKKSLFIPNSSKVALGMVFVGTVAFIGQTVAVLTLFYNPIAFENDGQAKTYKHNNISVTASSNLLSQQTIYASDVGYKGHTSSQVKCSVLCTTQVKSPFVLMLLSITLTYLYLVNLIIQYHAAAKRKKQS